MTDKKTILTAFRLPLLTAILVLAGCAKQDFYRTDGLTLGAGDAIARNTALQVIDPWPAGVEDTRLLFPADQGRPADPSAPSTPPAANP
jgi:hypothetical protein